VGYSGRSVSPLRLVETIARKNSGIEFFLATSFFEIGGSRARDGYLLLRYVTPLQPHAVCVWKRLVILRGPLMTRVLGSAPVPSVRRQRSGSLATWSLEIGRCQLFSCFSLSPCVLFTCTHPLNGHNRELNRGRVHVRCLESCDMHPSTPLGVPGH